MKKLIGMLFALLPILAFGQTIRPNILDTTTAATMGATTNSALAWLGGASLTLSNDFSAGTNNFDGGVIVSNLQVGASTPDNSPYGVGRPGFTGDAMDVNVTSNFPTIQILQTTPSGFENGAGIRLKSLAAGGVDWIISSAGQADIRGAKMFQLWNNEGFGGTNPGAWFWIDPAGDVFANSFNAASGTLTNLIVGTGLTSPGNVANFFTAADRSLVYIATAPFNFNGVPTGFGNGPGFQLSAASVGGGSWYVESQGNADTFPGQFNFFSGAGGGDIHFDTSGNVITSGGFTAATSVSTPSLIYTATNAAPANTVTPLRWMQVTVGGTNYQIPLYK